MDTRDFTTDAILQKLYLELATHADDTEHVAIQKEIRLLHHPEISSYISLYMDEGRLWAQIRIGYMFRAAAVPAEQRKDFTGFIMRPVHNPLTLPSGARMYLNTVFVNDPHDSQHRYGLDVVLDDIGVDRCAELFNYLLTAEY